MPLKTKWHTYDYWQNRGRYIIRGSKATRLNKRGQPLFSSKQTGVTGPAFTKPNQTKAREPHD